MRIERQGPVPKLKPRLERFFVEALGGEPLDGLQRPEVRKADYRCLGGLLAIELKCLEQDSSERLDNVLRELRKRDDWPTFFGPAPLQSFLQHLHDTKDVQAYLVDRVGRAIRNHIHKANKQLGAYEKAFPRKNIVKIVFLANEDHEIYDTNMVSYIVRHLLSRREKGQLLYPHIDSVVYLSERHATQLEGRIAFPFMSIEGAPIESARWKREVIDTIALRWAEWSQAHFHFGSETAKFVNIDHLSERMTRQQHWELEYKRRPYMRDLSHEELRDRFDEIICVSSLAFVNNSPMKPSEDEVLKCLAHTSHMILEMGSRAIPVAQFKYEPARMVAAATRLQLPSEVVAWFQRDLGRRS